MVELMQSKCTMEFSKFKDREFAMATVLMSHLPQVCELGLGGMIEVLCTIVFR